MLRKVSPRVRLVLVNVLFLVVGMAIGLAANVRTLPSLTGLAPSETYLTSLPTYRIAPPDVLGVDITSERSHASVEGDYLVLSDGSANLGFLGTVHVAGLTIAEATEAIRIAAEAKLSSPEVVVDVNSYNSQRYYIVEQGGDQGEHVHTFPITGNETALDAIAQIGGIKSPEDKRVWISRPSANGMGTEQVLPIDWDKIKRGASPTTNYQILPGDRVFIASNDPVNPHP